MHFFQCYYLFPFSTCFEQPSAHHRKWYAGPEGPAYQAVTYTE